MIKEKILKKFLNTKNNVYYTRCKKGLLPFFYNGLQDFAAKLKIITHLFSYGNTKLYFFL